VNDTCSSGGVCSCNPGFTGAQCTSCLPGYYGSLCTRMSLPKLKTIFVFGILIHMKIPCSCLLPERDLLQCLLAHHSGHAHCERNVYSWLWLCPGGHANLHPESRGRILEHHNHQSVPAVRSQHLPVWGCLCRVPVSLYEPAGIDRRHKLRVRLGLPLEHDHQPVRPHHLPLRDCQRDGVVSDGQRSPGERHLCFWLCCLLRRRRVSSGPPAPVPALRRWPVRFLA